jgi:hypothetical protein
MKQLSRFRWVGVAALSAAAIALLLAGHGKPNHRDTVTEPRAATKPAVNVEPKPPATNPKTQPVPELKGRAIAFLLAYYRILPGDTAAARRRRISAYITDGLSGRLAFGSNGAAGPSVQATVDTEDMVIRQASGQAEVTAPVLIFVSRSGNSSEKYVTLPTHSHWTFQSGQWLADSFN